jgi:membrane-associated HD superfamily phosphohydrolase
MRSTKPYLLGLRLLAAVRQKAKADIPFKGDVVFLISAVLVSAVISFLLLGYSSVRLPDYSVGDIARADVLVPSDILIMDEQATNARRASARDAVPPVYRYDPSTQSRLVSRLSGAFSVCRQILGSMPAGKRNNSFRRLSPTVQASIKAEMELVGPQIDDGLLDFLVQEQFSSEIEIQLASALRQTQASWLVEDDRSLAGIAGNIEAVSNAGIEKQLVPVQQVEDLERARQRLSEAVNSIFKAPAQIRRMASEWLGGSLTANLKFDFEATEARKAEAAEAVDPVLRQMKRGKVIVRQGDEISADQLKQIDAVRNVTPSLRSVPQFVGTNLLLLVLLMILGLLLRSSSIRQWNRARLITLSFATLVANAGLLKVLWFVSESLSRNFVANPFNNSRLFFPALPFAFGSMLITLLAGERVAQLFLIFYCP